MKPRICRNFTASMSLGFLVAFALTAAANAGTAPANASTSRTAPLYGGAVSKTRSHVFETQLMPDGVRIWFYSDKAAPANVEKSGGTADLKLPDGRNLKLALSPRQPTAKEPGVYFCPMHADVVERKPGECGTCGGMKLYTQDYLFGAADLAGVAPSGVVARIRLTELAGDEKEVTLTPTFPKDGGNGTQHKTGR